jgi:hypothetical protein
LKECPKKYFQVESSSGTQAFTQTYQLDFIEKNQHLENKKMYQILIPVEYS